MEETALQKIQERLRKEAPAGVITCAQALVLARELQVDPKVIGKACDMLQIRVRCCSLGLF